MNITRVQRLILGFLAAVVVTVIWGTVVQTQYNLAALRGIDVSIGPAINMRATLTDIFSGFSPTYGGYVVMPALLVAFLVAWQMVRRIGAPLLWFGLAGGLAILAAIPLVNWLAPLALLFGASRDFSCVVLMAAGGVLGGTLFAWVTRPTDTVEASHRRNPQTKNTANPQPQGLS